MTTTNTNEDDEDYKNSKILMSYLLLALLFTISHVVLFISLCPLGPENTLTFLTKWILFQSPFACFVGLCLDYYSKTEIFISKAILCINYSLGPYIVTFLVYLCMEPILDLVVSAGDDNYPNGELWAKNIVPAMFTTIVSGVALVAVREDCLVVARFFMAQSLMASLYLVRKDASSGAVEAALFPVFLALIIMLIPADGLSRRFMIMQDENALRRNLHENKVRKEAPKREKIKKREIFGRSMKS